MKVVFLGTPDFAVATLAQILLAGHEVVAVVTAPDKIQGRGMKTAQKSAVKLFAEAHNLLVLQPEKLRNPEFQAQLIQLAPDLGVVVAFRMLPESVWNLPKMGTLNLHGSLLPAYRGAAPIHWAVINGATETGVTTFRLQQAIDTGHLILQAKTDIGPNETTGDIHDKLMVLGANLVVQSIQILADGYVPQPQNETLVSHAPKLKTENTQLNPNLTCAQNHNFIRGLQPFPSAWSKIDDKNVKWLGSVVSNYVESQPPIGTLFSPDRKMLLLQCADGALEITQLQLEGKKRTTGKDFIHGHALPLQIQFTSL